MFYIKVNEENVVTQKHSEKAYNGYTEKKLATLGELIEVPIPNNPDYIEGKQVVEKYDANTNSIYYEYEDAHKTEEDLTKDEIQQLKLDNAELLMKQAMQDLESSQTKEDIGELMIKVAMLEMGGVI